MVVRSDVSGSADGLRPVNKKDLLPANPFLLPAPFRSTGGTSGLQGVAHFLLLPLPRRQRESG
ncbi:hypothetical protein Pmani_035044, partial [Petrolisthes manimaculis]